MAGIQIYIPLCLYLYSASGTTTQSNIIFTFHYASTYTASNVVLAVQMFYLHSTMPLLILISEYVGLETKVTIYIPLCLYLYRCHSLFAFYVYQNLHSTMPLLIRIEYYQPRNIFRIYIPLCLYLYRKVFQKDVNNYDYIPLCLYLYL